MPCVQELPPVTQRLVARSSTVMIAPFTGWYACTGISSVQRTIRLLNPTSNNFGAVFAYQLAVARPDNAVDWVTYGSAVTGATGPTTASVPVGTSTPPALNTTVTYWIRFGIGFSTSSGTDSADVRLDVAFEMFGEHLVSRTLELCGSSSSTFNEPITGFLPTGGLYSVKVAMVATGLVNSPRWKAVYRSASYDPDNPGTYSDVGAEQSAAGDYQTDEVSLTGVTDGLLQFGIGFRSNTDGTQAQMTLTVHLAVRRA
jgi:hypothetical protein